jgi:hypothetical protein
MDKRCLGQWPAHEKNKSLAAIQRNFAGARSRAA